VAVTAVGKFETWPVQVWADTPGLRVEAEKANGKLVVHVAKDAAVGPHLLRLYNADGASALKCFMVGEGREASEVEPNDELAKAQAVGELPVTVNGQLDKSGDVDGYAVTLREGQCLVASVQGRRLGSAIDPMLHLVDPAGNEVAYAQDGLGLDPLLVYRAPAAGTYVVRVSAFAFPPVADVRLAGGKDAVYRLNLTTGPFVRRAVPGAVRRGEKATVRLSGWNLATDHAEVDATAVEADASQVFVPVPNGEGRLGIDLVDVPQVVESGAAATRPTAVTLPVDVSGTIASAGEEDRFEFAVKKGERYTFAVRAGTLGSILDPVLRIEDAAGKQVAADDDSGGAQEPRVDWTAPADGTYRAVVGDLYGRGGAEYVYRLEVRRPVAGVSATVDADAYVLNPGKTAAVKVNVARQNGYAGGLVAVVTGLPAGVSATSAEVPAKGGEVTLTLAAAAEAKAWSGAVRVLVLGTEVGRPDGVVARVDLRKDRDTAGNQEFIDWTGEVWLTLSPTASAAVKKAP
jgi:hypothetical protein